MCFVHDAEWTAESYADAMIVAPKEFTCDECRRTIPAGSPARSVSMLEHGECRDCEEGCCGCVDALDEDEDPQDHECKCEKPNYGEEYEYQSCDDCRKFLEAVKASELAAGCKEYESQPAFEELIEELATMRLYDDEESFQRYIAKAREMFPELESNGYLAMIDERTKDEEESP